MKNLLKLFFSKRNLFISPDFNDIAGIIHERETFLRLIENERDRVNRNETHFSLILLKMDHVSRFERQSIQLIDKIKKRVRRIDRIGWYDDYHLGVLLPGTDASGAQRIVKDIMAGLNKSFFAPPCQTFCYPLSDFLQ